MALETRLTPESLRQLEQQFAEAVKARALELAGFELAGMRLVRSIEEAEERLIGSDRG